LQELGKNAEYVKIVGNGPNALDFHIAFYIGQLSARDPDAYFHIISKDTGFDPLIRHLKEIKIFAQREKELTEIPMLRISNVTTTEEKIEAIVMSLIARGQARPRKIKTLVNTIRSLFMKTLNDSEITSIIEKMKQRNLIAVENESVSYNPPIVQP
jgi:hypothetical protein